MKRWAWWGCALLFGLHQLLQKGLGMAIPWADNYLDPLLCMPLLLGLFEWEQQRLFGRRKLHLWEALVLTGLLSVLFECGFPRWSDRFTTDIWDVAAYYVGTAAYLLLDRCGYENDTLL